MKRSDQTFVDYKKYSDCDVESMLFLLLYQNYDVAQWVYRLEHEDLKGFYPNAEAALYLIKHKEEIAMLLFGKTEFSTIEVIDSFDEDEFEIKVPQFLNEARRIRKLTIINSYMLENQSSN